MRAEELFGAKGRLKRCVWLLAGLLAVTCGAQTSAPRSLLLPGGVAFDSAGNFFVADAGKHQVVEVSLAGVATVVAGTGVQGVAGDGGPAVDALLNAPSSVAVGADGTLYIADAGNQRVRAVSSGTIRTVAGSGARGSSGDGGDALLARLNTPLALAVDATGAVLIADSGNHRVRRLSAGILTTVAGNGTQGFAGDGGAATAAAMDTPAGLAVAPDGRVLVADSHNHRVRAIDGSGVIRTFAGSGVRGFSGDGGPALVARLFLPRGVAVLPSGAVVFADSDNHRLRSVDLQGTITTLAGSGVQSASAEASGAAATALDTPRAVAVSSFGAAVIGDARNRSVSEVAADNLMYGVVPAAARGSTVSVAPNGALVYGDGSVMVSVASAAPVALGTVTLLDAGKSIGTAALVNGGAAVTVASLASGSHALTALYSGDVLHASAVSAGLGVVVAPRVVTATALSATTTYGSTIPAPTGTLTGVLASDAADVVARFSTSALDLSPVGTYPIAVKLTGAGSGNYAAVLAAGSGSLQIVQAAATVQAQAPQAAYAGVPLTLMANVASATRGVPTGSVTFVEGGAVVGSGVLSGGVASGVYLNPTSGTHSLTAVYGGDGNFLAGSSAAVAISVGGMPDFTLGVSGSATQTVQGGSIAGYMLQVAPQPAPFSGSVYFSATGLPAGAKVSFTPSSLVPGNAPVSVAMAIQTVALTGGTRSSPLFFAVFVVPLAVLRKRRRCSGVLLATVVLLAAAAGCLAGCGARTVATSTGRTFPVTITATSTNLAGAVISHNTSVSLTVQ